ncbi:sensor histidine kinase [Paenibacillus sp. R14(2021)]|uniref:cache domain-containing sensor histidine kinase n=1 Tax=Paenibacillus sp. R14(2021) TaxID=2859228 RepID=UPI001C6154EE|nr:sensor histidine kinase [Paenibacillus sp. R14(2021)]
MRYSIRTKIFISFSVLLIASLSVVTLLWYRQYSSSLRESSEDFMYRSITEANKTFELTMKDIDFISTTIALNRPNVIDVLIGDAGDSVYDRLQKDRKLDNYIASFYGYKYYISGISVVSENGRSYSQGSTLTAEQFRASPWYKRMVERKGKPVFVTTHAGSDLNKVSAIPNQNVVSIARSIMDGGRPVGYVQIDFNYEVVQKMFSSPITEDGRLFLMDDKGSFVFAAHNLDINRNIGQTEYAAIMPKLSGSSGRLMMTVAGEPMYIVYYKSDYTNWTTAALVSKSALLASSKKTANASMLVPLLTMVAALLVATILARTITRGIGRLHTAMKRVGTGNLSETIAIRSGDEVEELSRGFNQMVESIKLLVEDVKRTEKNRHDMEFKALQAQINPHFLFNTLNQVKRLADIQKADNIKDLVSSLLVLLHNSMGKGGEIQTLHEETLYLRHYLNIQEFRYYDKFEAVFDIDESIAASTILKFTLQPIIENALIHGIEPLRGRGMITVKAARDGDDILIQVSDNGVGMPQDKLESLFEAGSPFEKNKLRFSGIGLRNVQERIKLHYGPKYGLSVTSVPDLYTTVTVRIPHREEE